MEQQKYQMYVFHFVEYGEPEWPNKKVWFNAKKWLSDEENYLKINDHDFIYKKSMQIPNTDLFIVFIVLYCMRKELQSKIYLMNSLYVKLNRLYMEDNICTLNLIKIHCNRLFIAF